jgi:hypothetical protein
LCLVFYIFLCKVTCNRRRLATLPVGHPVARARRPSRRRIEASLRTALGSSLHTRLLLSLVGCTAGKVRSVRDILYGRYPVIHGQSTIDTTFRNSVVSCRVRAVWRIYRYYTGIGLFLIKFEWYWYLVFEVVFEVF